jgi:hypothetical protein
MSKNKVTFKMPPLGAQHAKQTIDKKMAQVQNPVTREQATTEITKMIEQSGMPPEMFIEIGKLCEDAINDKKKYSKLVDYMVKHKLETAESMKKPDFQMLASMVVIGKVAEELSQPTQGM